MALSVAITLRSAVTVTLGHTTSDLCVYLDTTVTTALTRAYGYRHCDDFIRFAGLPNWSCTAANPSLATQVLLSEGSIRPEPCSCDF